MNKTELTKAIKELGGEADMNTRKAELQQQLMSLNNNEGTISGHTEKVTSDYQKYTAEMHRASDRKRNLVEFMKERLGINASENATMLQLKTQCIDKIYDLSIADATDPVGFGKHGSKSYLELRQTDPQYCEWVQTTSQEGEANPRLHRLAQWLSRATTDSLTAPRVATKWKGRTSDVAPKTQMEHVTRSSASSSEVGTGSMKTEMMAEMMEAIQALRSEVADLQSERRGSRPRRENHVDTEMESIGSFEKVSLKKK